MYAPPRRSVERWMFVRLALWTLLAALVGAGCWFCEHVRFVVTP